MELTCGCCSFKVFSKKANGTTTETPGNSRQTNEAANRTNVASPKIHYVSREDWAKLNRNVEELSEKVAELTRHVDSTPERVSERRAHPPFSTHPRPPPLPAKPDFMPKQLHMSILDETFREPSEDDDDSDNDSRSDVEVSSRPAAACTNKDPGKEKDATARILTTEASSTDGDATAKAKKLKLPLHIPPEIELKTNSVRYLEVNIIRAEHLPRMDITGASDPYVTITVGDQKAVTKTLKNTLSPAWNEHFIFELVPSCQDLLLTVMDWDRFQADEVIGECRIHLADVLTDNPGIPGKQEARALQIVQPGSNTAIVGKDKCYSTLWVSLALPKPENDEPRETASLLLDPPIQSAAAATSRDIPLTSGHNISSNKSPSKTFLQDFLPPNSKTADSEMSMTEFDNQKVANFDGEGWKGGAARLALHLGAPEKESGQQTALASPRNVFDSILESMISPHQQNSNISMTDSRDKSLDANKSPANSIARDMGKRILLPDSQPEGDIQSKMSKLAAIVKNFPA